MRATDCDLPDRRRDVAQAVAQAADEKIVNYYKETCGTCHGEAGEGMKGLAPPLKGNKFVTGGSAADIGTTITKGPPGRRQEVQGPALADACELHERWAPERADRYIKGDLQK